MLRIYAERYVALGQDFQEMEMLARSIRERGVVVIPEENCLSEGDLLTLAQLMVDVQKHCREIGLKVSAKVAGTINEELLRTANLSMTLVGDRIAERYPVLHDSIWP
jgi:hypothetical protein